MKLACIIIMGILAMTAQASADELTEYQKGFDAGYRLAVRVLWENRNHYRNMLGYKSETHEQAVARVFGGTWPAPPPPSVGERTHGPVNRAEDMIMDGIDMYVVLPEPRGTVLPPP